MIPRGPLQSRLIDAAVWLLLAVFLLWLFLFLRPAQATEPEPVLLIVDGQGNTLLRCQLPTAYLLPPAKAIVCEQPPFVYRDGFEP